jgi:hypothetical protein
MTRIVTPLYVHLVDNLPARDGAASGLNITVDLIAGRGIFTLTKKQTGAATLYELEIPDIQQIGLDPQLSDNEVASAIGDLTLSLNVASARAIFSAHLVSHGIPRIERDPISRSGVSDSVSTVMGSAVRVDEDAVLNILQRSRQWSATSVERRALNNFAEACATHDGTAAIRHYATVAEVCVNRGRPTKSQFDGPDLDREIAVLTGFPEPRMKQMRVVANRTKHADRSSMDHKEYETAISDLASLLRDTKAATTIALQRTILF